MTTPNIDILSWTPAKLIDEAVNLKVIEIKNYILQNNCKSFTLNSVDYDYIFISYVLRKLRNDGFYIYKSNTDQFIHVSVFKCNDGMEYF